MTKVKREVSNTMPEQFVAVFKDGTKEEMEDMILFNRMIKESSKELKELILKKAFKEFKVDYELGSFYVNGKIFELGAYIKDEYVGLIPKETKFRWINFRRRCINVVQPGSKKREFYRRQFRLRKIFRNMKNYKKLNAI